VGFRVVGEEVGRVKDGVVDVVKGTGGSVKSKGVSHKSLEMRLDLDKGEYGGK